MKVAGLKTSSDPRESRGNVGIGCGGDLDGPLLSSICSSSANDLKFAIVFHYCHCAHYYGNFNS